MNTGNVNTVWDQALRLLSAIDETKSPLARTYLNYLVPVSLDETQLVFSIRLLHAQQIIETRYLSYIGEAVAAVLSSPRNIVLTFDESAFQDIQTQPASSQSVPSQQSSSQPQQTQQSFQSDPLLSQPLPHSTQQFAAVQIPSQLHQTNLSPSQATQVTPPANQQFSDAQAGSLPYQQAGSLSEAMPNINPPLENIPALSTASLNVASTGTNPSTPANNPIPVLNTNQTAATNPGLASLFAPDTQPQSAHVVEPDSRFQFSNYVIGESNQIAYTLSLRVAEEPGQYFNPLFIYGKSGLGKTHLLLSIEHYIKTYLPEKQVVYAPITGFMNDFTGALQEKNNLATFKHKYHTCDVLLIDDVQYLEGKAGTTDALFDIFNMFTFNDKQIVLSADRHPGEINIDERFTSRFGQGITIDIQPPNHELKTAILKEYKRYYCNFLNIPEVDFSDGVIQKIVELSGSNIRELEGAVSNLIVSASCKPNDNNYMAVSYEDVENILGKTFFHKRHIDINMVMRAVESHFNVSHDELLSEKRSKGITYPRQIAMHLTRRYTDMSYPSIGKSFNKDHTTAMYADKNIQSKMAEEVGIKAEVDHIADMIIS